MIIASDILQKIIAKCWTDSDFKRKLILDPAATLAQEGVIIDSKIKINVLENSDKAINMVIPQYSTDLSDETLEGVSGGFYYNGLVAGAVIIANDDSNSPWN